MARDKEEQRLEVDKRNKEDIADAVRDSNPTEANRNDNAAKGLDAEIESGRGNDPGKNRS